MWINVENTEKLTFGMFYKFTFGRKSVEILTENQKIKIKNNIESNYKNLHVYAIFIENNDIIIVTKYFKSPETVKALPFLIPIAVIVLKWVVGITSCYLGYKIFEKKFQKAKKNPDSSLNQIPKILTDLMKYSTILIVAGISFILIKGVKK